MMKNFRLSKKQPLVQGSGSAGGDNIHQSGPAQHTRGGSPGKGPQQNGPLKHVVAGSPGSDNTHQTGRGMKPNKKPGCTAMGGHIRGGHEKKESAMHEKMEADKD